MKIVGTIRLLTVSMVAVGFLLSQAAPASVPAPNAAKAIPRPLMQDVGLQKGGTLMGQLVCPSGTPVAGAKISLLQNNRELAKTITDKQGKFSFAGLRGGVYRLVTADSDGLYRLWAAGTAPKSTGQIAQVVAGGPVMRGQYTMGRVGKWLTSPVGLAAVAATAVAVPVALHNSDRDPSE